MTHDSKPLSDLVAQGWEVIGFTGATDQRSVSVLLRRQRQHKVLKIRLRGLGLGFRVEEIDI